MSIRVRGFHLVFNWESQTPTKSRKNRNGNEIKMKVFKKERVRGQVQATSKKSRPKGTTGGIEPRAIYIALREGESEHPLQKNNRVNTFNVIFCNGRMGHFKPDSRYETGS